MKIKLIFSILLFFCVLNNMSRAQYVDLYTINNEFYEFETSKIQRIDFQNNKLNVVLKDKSSKTISINDFSGLKFNSEKSTTGIKQIELMMDNYIYPNPNDGNFSLIYYVNKPGNVLVEILDQTGKEVYKLAINNLETGEYKYEFNSDKIFINKLITGVYIFKLASQERIITEKLIIK